MWVVVAAASTVAATGWNTEAQACSPDQCQASKQFGDLELLTPEIPTGGELVFKAVLGGGVRPDQEDLDKLSVSIEADGVQLEGALEPLEAFGGFVWRPDDPLASGVVLDVLVSIDNTAIEQFLECGDAMITISESVDVTNATATTPSLAVTPTQMVWPGESRSLDTMVCCDGAYPAAQPNCGSVEIDWQEGSCTWIEQIGRLNVGLSVDQPPTSAETANTVYRTVFDDGSVGEYRHQPTGFEIWREEAFCVQIEALNLLTGDTVLGDEMCLGDDVADQLGPQFVDPTEFIEANCEQDPYICATVEEETLSRWDSDDCNPFDGEPPDSGGSGSGSGGSGSGSGSDSEGSASGPDSGGDTDGGTAGLDDGGEGCACSVNKTGGQPVAWAIGLVALFGLRRRRSFR